MLDGGGEWWILDGGSGWWGVDECIIGGMVRRMKGGWERDW